MLWSFVLIFASAAGSARADGKPGLNRRVPWTTSRMYGSPDPPAPYKVEVAFPNLEFDRPVAMTGAPGTDRLFVAEQTGKIYSFPNDATCDTLNLVVDLKMHHPKLTAIYGLTFHPDFARNRTVYICYVLANEQSDGTRVVRFNMSRTDPPRIDPQTEHELITWLSGGHNGGCLKFGPDGYLYISTGDGAAASPPDPSRVGQEVSNLLSAVLRIDVDRAEDGRPYRVPPDNPLVGIENARPEIWAYGFRNPWKMSFDSTTGELWVGDVGWELWEMVYRVQKGGNYGWSIMEGRQPVHPQSKRGPTPILPPTIEHPHSEAASITGGFVYRGNRLQSLVGAYIYGDYQSGIIWGARVKDDELVWCKELARTPLQLVGFAEDHAHELYLLDYRQKIYRLVANIEEDRSARFPRRLSETGLFATTAEHTPAAGVIPYSINAEQWSDDAKSERWLAVPATGSIVIDKRGNWQFPDGSVLAKTVSIETERGTVDGFKRIETQILHREAGSWRAYTYAWNDGQTDADLADVNGLSRTFKIRDPQAPGGVREQEYRIAGRRECALCHNPWVQAKTTVFGVQSASPLAVQTMQWNCEHDYDGRTANQLQTLTHIGLLQSQNLGSIRAAPLLADPYDETADLNERARAYLHVNCSHCHQFNAGGAATIALAYGVELEKARMLDVRPTQGAFNISNARIVSPGDPLGSVLFYRMAKLGGGRMPRLGSHEVDDRALWMIHDWIAQLPPVQSASTSAGKTDRQGTHTPAASESTQQAISILRNADSSEARAQAIRVLTASTRGALALLRFADREEPSDAVRAQIISLVRDHPASEVRDLFERFVPVSQRIQRLGEVVDPAEILNLKADSGRGRNVFFNNSAAACKNCHRVRSTGETLGPDLTLIGKKYSREQLLQHILEPSRFMEPKYVPYLVETVEGQFFSGLLETRTENAVVIKDANNKLHRIPAGQIEQLVRQQKSLMPELLLRDLTRQEVADLLAYLASLN